VSVDAPPVVRCGVCNRPITLSAGVAARWQGRRERPVCDGCLHPPVAANRQAAPYRRWWLEQSGLTLEELREIGRMLGWC
jgi:hypothetical protein